MHSLVSLPIGICLFYICIHTSEVQLRYLNFQNGSSTYSNYYIFNNICSTVNTLFLEYCIFCCVIEFRTQCITSGSETLF